MGERVPQHVQNIVIRDYCEKNKLFYLLSSTEYVFKNSSLIISLKIKRVKEIDNDSVKRNLLHAKVTGEIDKPHPINKIDTLDFNIGFKVLIK